MRVFSVAQRSDAAALDHWGRGGRALSEADPETLARAVRAHKAGDAFAQAALTLALMLAIGAVAVVLSSGRAAAADILVGQVSHHATTLGALAGGALLLTSRMVLRQARVKARRHR